MGPGGRGSNGVRDYARGKSTAASRPHASSAPGIVKGMMQAGSSAELDVVVIGGGVQGLLALSALIEKGYSCALVSDGDLGSGQTLHSHGFLNSGFGFAGPELQRASIDVVQPDLVERGLKLDQDWIFIPPPGFPFPEGLPAAILPPGFTAALGEGAVRWADSSFPKRRLIEV